MHKDFELILSEAARLGIEMPATKAAAAVSAEEAADGQDEDFSAVIRRMEQQSATGRPQSSTRSPVQASSFERN